MLPAATNIDQDAQSVVTAVLSWRSCSDSSSDSNSDSERNYDYKHGYDCDCNYDNDYDYDKDYCCCYCYANTWKTHLYFVKQLLGNIM